MRESTKSQALQQTNKQTNKLAHQEPRPEQTVKRSATTK